jgi:hypothetical protein
MVQLCNPSEFDKAILCDPVTGERVIVVTSYSNTGVPTSTAYTMAGAPYGGAIAALVQCDDADEESDALEFCDNGVTFLRWYVKRNGQPTGATFDTTLAGAPYIVVGTPTMGACVVAALPIVVTGGGAQIAGPTKALTPAFAGTPDIWGTGAVPGILHSVTVSARGVTDGFVGLTANQITISMPDGTSIAMMDGETRTFSVVRDRDNELLRQYIVTAVGNAYANITYTFV